MVQLLTILAQPSLEAIQLVPKHQLWEWQRSLCFALTSYRSTDADSRRESCKKQLLKKQIREAVLCKVQVPPCDPKKGRIRMSSCTSSARQPEKQAIMSTTLKQIDPSNSKPQDTRSPDITASTVIVPYSRLLLCLEGSSAKCHDLGNLGSIDKHARNSGNYWLFFEPG